MAVIGFRMFTLHNGAEYYSVDLTRGKAIPILGRMDDHQFHIGSSLVTLGSKVYSISGFSDDPFHLSTDVFVFDSNSPTAGWKKCAPPREYQGLFPNAIGHKNRIYGFIRRSGVEIYDPDSDSWEFHPMPELPQVARLVSDPCNDRILIDFYKRKPCAFYPNTLTCLDLPKGQNETWNSRSLILDDVMYFGYGLSGLPVAAYDLSRGKWLEVKWSSPYRADIEYEDRDGFYHLGNGKLCLVASWPSAEDESCAVLLITTFTVRKEDDARGTLVVVATPSEKYKIMVEGGHGKSCNFFKM